MTRDPWPYFVGMFVCFVVGLAAGLFIGYSA